MYNVNAAYLAEINKNVRRIEYSGTITTQSGNIVTFGDSDIVKGSGTIRNVVCDGSLSIGNVPSSELGISLFFDVDRYELFNAKITISARVAGRYSIPMGEWYVAECDRSKNQIKIVAYDAMTKFDKEVDPAILFNLGAKEPIDWLRYICQNCGVKLSVRSLATYANGDRAIGYGGGAEDVKTYRDVLSYLAAYLGCNVYINRSGNLALKAYSAKSVREIAPQNRYSSDISDFISYFTGLYATYIETEESEYRNNTEYAPSGDDDGLVYNLEVNPFLQITDKTNRENALDEVLGSLAKAVYTPFSADLPEYPELDILDTIKFTGNQAGASDIGAITSMTYKFHGGMSVECAGENPFFQSVENRNDKNIQGLSSGSNSVFVVNARNTENVTVDTEDILVCDSVITTNSDFTRCLVAFTATYNLPEASIVTIKVKLDDDVVYTAQDNNLAGVRTMSVNCGVEIVGKDEHEIIIMMNSNVGKPPEILSIESRLAALGG